MRPRLVLFTMVLLGAACAAEPEPSIKVCHFASGRPCPADTVCLGSKGNECNYASCDSQDDSDTPVGTAVACAPGETAPVAGGPFNCDPSTIARDPLEGGAFPPPNGVCPLGSLYALDPARASPYLFCVPVEQCEPLPCDPQFAGDGCPADLVCAPASGTCVAP